MSKVNLPYGIDNFAKVRESNCYYIDKTGFIKELLDRTFDVNLITRPRLFWENAHDQYACRIF